MTRFHHQQLACIAVAWAVSNCFLMVSLQPVLFRVLIDSAGMSLTSSSAVLSANMLGGLIGNLGALFTLNNARVKPVLAGAAALLAAAQGFMAVVPATPGCLMVLMFCAGIGAGLLGAVALATIVGMNRPTRVFSLAVVAQIVTGAASTYIAPKVMSAFGVDGLYVSLAAMALLVLPTISWVIDLVPSRAEGGNSAREKAHPAATGHLLLLLLSVAIVYLSNNAIWPYLELILGRGGMRPEQIATAISIGQFASCAGAIAASRWERNSHGFGIAIGLALMAAATALFTIVHGVVAASIDVAVLMGSLYFAVPLILGTLALFDSRGRLVVWSQLAMGAGLASGPFAASVIVEHRSLDALLWASTFTCCLALSVALLAFRRLTYVELSGTCKASFDCCNADRR